MHLVYLISAVGKSKQVSACTLLPLFFFRLSHRRDKVNQVHGRPCPPEALSVKWHQCAGSESKVWS